jgi:hypothetical protein
MDATSRRTRNEVAENQDSGLNGRLQTRDFTPLREAATHNLAVVHSLKSRWQQVDNAIRRPDPSPRWS